VKTWQQTQIRTTPITATLVIATALALGAAGGYAMRAFAQLQNVASATSTTEMPVASIPDATLGMGPVAAHNPAVGLRPAELEDSTLAASIPDATWDLGPVAAHNPRIGLHQLDSEDLP
jgi:hypothetical protein